MKTSSIAAAALLWVAPVFAGINCKGNFWCFYDNWNGFIWPLQNQPWTDVTVKLQQQVNRLPDNLLVPYNMHIACTRHICVTLHQSSHGPEEGMLGSAVKKMAAAVVNHGCKFCGRAPLGWPQNNHDKWGYLQFNLATDPCQVTGEVDRIHPWGMCPQFELWLEEDKERAAYYTSNYFDEGS